MLLKASQGASSTSSDTNNNHGNNDITRRMFIEVVDEIKDDLSYLHRRYEEDELIAGVRMMTQQTQLIHEIYEMISGEALCTTNIIIRRVHEIFKGFEYLKLEANKHDKTKKSLIIY